MSKDTGKNFIEMTKYPNIGVSDQQLGVAPPPIVEVMDDEDEGLVLPRPDEVLLEDKDLLQIITERNSLRKFSQETLTLEELSFLLWCTQGIKQVHGKLAILKTVPSAGARHAFETYLLINHVEGLEPGVYQYSPLTHRLIPFGTKKDLSPEIVQACHGQAFVKKAAVTFFWIAYPYRMTWRYQERGYRYLFIDAGHVGQNLYLAAEAIGGGACAVAAFDDDALAALFRLEKERALVIYLAAVGKREKS